MSIFVTQLVPHNEVKNVKGIVQAALNFSHSIIDAIKPFQVYALLPLTEKKTQSFTFEYNNTTAVQCRAFPHNKAFRVFNVIIENIIIIKHIIFKNQNDIWFYNLSFHNIICFIILKFFFRKKCFILLADFSPEFISSKIFLSIMRYADGIISLSSKTKYFFPKHKNFVINPGIINLRGIVTTKRDSFNKSQFLFAGSLNPHAGIDLALKTFSILPKYDLFISGEGNTEEYIKQMSAKFENIHYLGFLDYKSYLEILGSIDIVLNLRNPEYIENEYNFPSKILEYFINNKLLISTLKYETIDENLYYYSEYKEESLKKTIEKIVQTDYEYIEQKLKNANNYVLTNFSFDQWNKLVKKVEANA